MPHERGCKRLKVAFSQPDAELAARPCVSCVKLTFSVNTPCFVMGGQNFSTVHKNHKRLSNATISELEYLKINCIEIFILQVCYKNRMHVQWPALRVKFLGPTYRLTFTHEITTVKTSATSTPSPYTQSHEKVELLLSEISDAH